MLAEKSIQCSSRMLAREPLHRHREPLHRHSHSSFVCYAKFGSVCTLLGQDDEAVGTSAAVGATIGVVAGAPGQLEITCTRMS